MSNPFYTSANNIKTYKQNYYMEVQVSTNDKLILGPTEDKFAVKNRFGLKLRAILSKGFVKCVVAGAK